MVSPNNGHLKQPYEESVVQIALGKGKLRDEYLDREIFTHVLEPRVVLTEFRQDYNPHLPHSSLNYEPPPTIFFRLGEPAAATELFTAAPSTPTSMVTHSRLVGSHNDSTVLTI